jgi:hypothetical protein
MESFQLRAKYHFIADHDTSPFKHLEVAHALGIASVKPRDPALRGRRD